MRGHKTWLAHGIMCASSFQVHNLSGPIRVTDAEGKPAVPGDILVVEICDLGALEGDEWGFTGIFDRENGKRDCCRSPGDTAASHLDVTGPLVAGYACCQELTRSLHRCRVRSRMASALYGPVLRRASAA